MQTVPNVFDQRIIFCRNIHNSNSTEHILETITIPATIQRKKISTIHL